MLGSGFAVQSAGPRADACGREIPVSARRDKARETSSQGIGKAMVRRQSLFVVLQEGSAMSSLKSIILRSISWLPEWRQAFGGASVAILLTGAAPRRRISHIKPANATVRSI